MAMHYVRILSNFWSRPPLAVTCFFLALAEQQGFLSESYSDTPVACLEKTDGSGLEITLIKLYPKTVFSGEHQPGESVNARIHAGAHKRYFIGNSIEAKITVFN